MSFFNFLNMKFKCKLHFFYFLYLINRFFPVIKHIYSGINIFKYVFGNKGMQDRIVLKITFCYKPIIQINLSQYLTKHQQLGYAGKPTRVERMYSKYLKELIEISRYHPHPYITWIAFKNQFKPYFFPCFFTYAEKSKNMLKPFNTICVKWNEVLIIYLCHIHVVTSRGKRGRKNTLFIGCEKKFISVIPVFQAYCSICKFFPRI